MSDQSKLSPKIQTIAHLSLAALAFVIAWWIWNFQWGELWLLKFYAWVFAFGGLMRLGKGLFELTRLVVKQYSLRKYKAAGSKQKSDRVADENDLRAKGLIK